MDFQSRLRTHPQTLGECFQLPPRGVLTSWQRQKGPFSQGGFRWKALKDTKHYSKDPVTEEMMRPLESSISLIIFIIKVSPSLTTALVNGDSRHSYVTEILQDTSQESEKLAEIPVLSGRNPSRLQCYGGPFRLALCSFCYRAHERVAFCSCIHCSPPPPPGLTILV